MNTWHVSATVMPDWVKQQVEAGNTVIHNAPRPLTGDATNDTWELDFVRGRSYAALNPNGPHFEASCFYNQRMDAYHLIYVSEEDAYQKGLAYYLECYGNTRMAANLHNEAWLAEHRQEIIERGIDVFNGYD
jgi:hypothetical protein